MNCVRKKRIVFTGGGSAGHVTPNNALIEAYGNTADMHYIGMKNSIEQQLIAPMNIPFHAISAGKLRRYMTLKHMAEPFKLLKGFFQSLLLLTQIKPDLVFSKGGFVSVPVVLAAWIKGIPVVAHESDMTPGLANRICLPFVQKICVNFAEVKKYFKNQDQVFVTGTPVRHFLLEGSAEKALKITNFTPKRLTIMVIGGSLGAVKINQVVRESLPELLKSYQVIHICGKGNLDKKLKDTPYYYQTEFVHEELADLLALSDVVISRSGANMLCELLTLAKPHLLIPLSKAASRGDQIDNALYFEKKGVSVVLAEEKLTPQTLEKSLLNLIENKDSYAIKIKELGMASATEKVKAILDQTMGNESCVESIRDCKTDV